MNAEEVLKELCLAPAPSGYEKRAAEVFSSKIRPFVDRIMLDRMGNVMATLDGTDCGRIVYSPYQLILEDVAPGKHILSLKLFGNRFNTFGQLHLAANSSYRWYGPNSYRTTGDLWCYEYRTRPTGILASPMLIELED